MMTYDDRHIADSMTRLEIASVLVEAAYNSMKEFAEFKAEAGLCKAAREMVKEAYHAVSKIEFDRTISPKDEDSVKKAIEKIVPLPADNATAGNPNRWTTSTMNNEQEKQEKKCPYGYGSPDMCGHCLSSGACDATVLTSCPPQYNMCPFRGSGYIDCSKA